jgi:dsRNA-specific ribonuclease
MLLESDIDKIFKNNHIFKHFIFALTDSSVVDDIHHSYEGYEFHGDGIVNATTKSFIFKKYFHTAQKIGDLSELENHLRSKPILAGYSNNLGIPQYIINVPIDSTTTIPTTTSTTTPSTTTSTTTSTNKRKYLNKANLAEDLFEAFVGALAVVIDEIYPDTPQFGHFVASNFVSKQIEKISNQNLQIGHLNTAKKRTIIKELFQKAKFGDVDYIILQKSNKTENEHQPFIVTIKIPSLFSKFLKKYYNYDSPIFGIGTNFVLNIAKENAAQEMLMFLQIYFGIDTAFSEKIKLEIMNMTDESAMIDLLHSFTSNGITSNGISSNKKPRQQLPSVSLSYLDLYHQQQQHPIVKSNEKPLYKIYNEYVDSIFHCDKDIYFNDEIL